MRRRSLALLDDEETTGQDTEDTIEEGEADKSDKETDKKEDGKKDEEEYKPDEEEEDQEENKDDTEEDNDEADETTDENTPADDLGGDAPEETDKPAEDKERHDTGVNSTDIVVNASNVLRAAKEIVEDKQVSTEDSSDHRYLEELYQSADGSGKGLGRISMELEEMNSQYQELSDTCQDVSRAQDALADPYENHVVGRVGLEGIHILMKRIAQRNNVTLRPMRGVAKEARSGRMNDSQRHNLALEGIGSMFRAMIDAICDAFRRLWKWIKDFFSVATDKTKKTKEVSTKLVERHKELKKKYNDLNSEKKKQIEELFALCQKFESEKALDTISPIPEGLKSSEEKIKKMIQERGYRLKRSDTGTFYVAANEFREPSETKKENIAGLTKLFDWVGERSIGAAKNIEVIVKLTNTYAEAPEDGREKKLEEVFKAYAEFCSNFYDDNNSFFEPCVVDEIIKGLSIESQNKVVVKLLNDNKIKLPDEKTLVLVVPAQIHLDSAPTNSDETITLASQYASFLGDLKLKLDTRSTTGQREDGYVNHTEFDKIGDDLEAYIDLYLNEIDNLMKAQVKLSEKVGGILTEEIDKTRAILEKITTADKALILNLNTFSAFITQTFASTIPNLNKCLITHAGEYCKHINQSLNAFDACMEIVK